MSEEIFYYKPKHVADIISNENKGYKFSLRPALGYSTNQYFACTVGELRELLSKYPDADYIEFSGDDGSGCDYGDATDDRGISIYRMMPFPDEKNKEFNDHDAKERVAKEKRLREEADKKSAYEMEYLKTLLKKYPHIKNEQPLSHDKA